MILPYTDSVETIRLLLEAGADANQYVPRDDDTPLLHAVKKGKTGLCDLLLQHGASPTLRNKRGMTCLHVAVKHHALGALKLLLQLDVIDVDDACNMERLTPLQTLRCSHSVASGATASCSCVAIAMCLVQAGADPRAVSLHYIWLSYVGCISFTYILAVSVIHMAC